MNFLNDSKSLAHHTLILYKKRAFYLFYTLRKDDTYIEINIDARCRCDWQFLKNGEKQKSKQSLEINETCALCETFTFHATIRPSMGCSDGRRHRCIVDNLYLNS
jgi:hypothetical protein